MCFFTHITWEGWIYASITLGSGLVTTFLNWGEDCSLLFLLHKVQYLSSTKLTDILPSGLLTSVYLSEHLSVYKPPLLTMILDR